MTISRPVQLAPVRVGCGKAVHLGCLSSITGPDGSPRYVAAWCGASGSGDNVRAGEAITEPINCRTCLRTQPRSTERINANLTGERTTPPPRPPWTTEPRCATSRTSSVTPIPVPPAATTAIAAASLPRPPASE